MAIVLLDIPGLHVGYLGCYGNDWVATPNLDRLASQAVVFDRHYAGGPGDLATGRSVLPGAGDGTSVVDAPSSPAGIFEGFHPVVVTARSSLSTEAALAHVFKAVVSAVKKNVATDQVVWAELPSLAPPWDLPAEALSIYFDEAEPDQTPWPDPPPQLTMGDEHLDRLQCTCAAVVSHFDSQLGMFLDTLGERGLLDRLLLVITARHGLPLGEHGWIGRQRAWQHEEQVHLPLIIRFPEGGEGGLRIGALTQSADILPTLIEHLGTKTPVADAPGSPGQSLWPLIRQEVTQVRAHVCSGDRVGAGVEWALRTLDWALLLPRSVPDGDRPRAAQLYVKPEDRWEVNDVAQHHPELVEQLTATLLEFAAAPASRSS